MDVGAGGNRLVTCCSPGVSAYIALTAHFSPFLTHSVSCSFRGSCCCALATEESRRGISSINEIGTRTWSAELTLNDI